MILTIAIPTYNNCTFLEKNIKLLCEHIRNNSYQKIIGLQISDNNSPDQTSDKMSELIKRNSDISISYYKNTQNVGAGKNFINAIDLSKTEFVLLLGDDDFMDEAYLKEVIRLIKDEKYGCIIPSYYNISKNGVSTGYGRDIGKKRKTFSQGFYNCFINSWRAHQMSGLVFRKGSFSSDAIKAGLTNPYTEVYFITRSCLYEKTCHLTEYPIKVTRPLQKEKTWGYENDGRINDVFENYANIAEFKPWQRFLLEVRFLDTQYWRYAMYLKLGPRKFITCIYSIMSAPNATLPTRILFPLLMVVILAKKSITLLFSGELIKTLRRKIE